MSDGGKATFEELMAELEEITAKLAAGDLGIEAAADLYERASRLHALATERLQQVKARVEGLTGPGSAAGASGAPASAGSGPAPAPGSGPAPAPGPGSAPAPD